MFELWLFTTDADLACRCVDAGVEGVVIDWESANKMERQLGTDLECNQDTVEDLIRIRKAVSTKIVCRINAMGVGPEDEVESAIGAGADLILLPMVKCREDVEKFLKFINLRTAAGILLETEEAVANAAKIAELPIDYAYVGLNDLAISRKSKNIFTAVADGTVDRLREIFSKPRFGFGGVTVVDKGFPVPFGLLLDEMSRLDCDFGFLRRSFKRDIQGRDINAEIANILGAFAARQNRTDEAKINDRLEFLERVEELTHDEAPAESPKPFTVGSPVTG